MNKQQLCRNHDDMKATTWQNSPLPSPRLDGLFYTQTISASDSTIHCKSERHLISMTTKKDMIPSRRKLN